MKRIAIIGIFTLFSLCSCWQDDSREGTPITEEMIFDRCKPGNEIRVLIMGDSRGFYGYSWERLPYTVLNTARGGMTTAYTISRLHEIDLFQPDYVIVFSGPNDERDLTQQQFADNIDYIEAYVSARDVTLVLVDILMSSALYDPKYDFFRDYIAASPCYFNPHPDDAWFTDNCHLNADGYEQLSQAIIVLCL
jgi:lysophospholipase L1-like esterase